MHDTETGIPPERAVPGGTIRIGRDLKGPVRAIQQATVNLFADMGVQPSTLQRGLLRATRSADALSPVSRIVTPGDGARMAGEMIEVAGTARDSGGGVVGGVEVSLDGGVRWHRAEGTDTWRYRARVDAGTMQIVSRAVDDSGNIEAPAAPVRVTVADTPE